MAKKISDYTNETSAVTTDELLLDDGTAYKALALSDLLVDSNLPLYWDSSDNVYVPNGSFTAIAGTASGQTADTNANGLIVDGNANSGMSVLSGSSSIGIIYFGDSSDSSVGGFKYSHASNTLTFRTNAQDNATLDSDGNFSVLNGFFNLGSPTELTISSGAVTATKSAHTIDTESDAASDDLDTINGGTEGDLLILQQNTGTRTAVVKDNVGNIRLAGSDFSLSNTNKSLVLYYTGSVWIEISRSSNTA